MKVIIRILIYKCNEILFISIYKKKYKFINNIVYDKKKMINVIKGNDWLVVN